MWPFSSSAAITSLDDIEFWVGAGANRAGLVIDWAEDSDEPAALAWGFRWDGAASGRDMLVAVLSADDRLFAKLGGSPANPVAVYGVGYDANDDGAFGIDDSTQFTAAGIAIASPADLAVSVDPGDCYAEGWFTGLWHYGVATGNPFDGGSWHSPPTGMAGRLLADGSWDSWAFTPSFDFTAFAMSPIAALPPATMPGDYNGDEVIDALDYDVWAGALGATGMHAADGNGDGVVNVADYVVWRDRHGASAGRSQLVPEPAASWIAPAFLYYFTTAARRARSRNMHRQAKYEARQHESTKSRKGRNRADSLLSTCRTFDIS